MARRSSPCIRRLAEAVVGKGAETASGPLRDSVSAPFAYYRFRKPTYTGEERRAMVDRMRQHIAKGRNVFTYFKHEETPEGALYAVELLREVDRRRVVV